MTNMVYTDPKRAQNVLQNSCILLQTTHILFAAAMVPYSEVTTYRLFASSITCAISLQRGRLCFYTYSIQTNWHIIGLAFWRKEISFWDLPKTWSYHISLPTFTRVFLYNIINRSVDSRCTYCISHKICSLLRLGIIDQKPNVPSKLLTCGGIPF